MSLILHSPLKGKESGLEIWPTFPGLHVMGVLGWKIHPIPAFSGEPQFCCLNWVWAKMCAALGTAMGVSRGYGGTLLRSLLIAQSCFDIRILLSVHVIVVTPILLLKGGVKWGNKAHCAFSVNCKVYCGHLNFWSTLWYWTLFKF
jgi:hypothetical protein